MKLISGNGETSSRLPAFSLFLPGTCPNNRDRRTVSVFDGGASAEGATNEAQFDLLYRQIGQLTPAPARAA